MAKVYCSSTKKSPFSPQAVVSAAAVAANNLCTVYTISPEIVF